VPKFAESQRLDPGIGTLMNLGDCYEKSGKIASAWATYREAVAEANRTVQKKQREKDALVLAARVEPKLSRLLVRVPAPTNGYPGVQIKRDGQVVDRAQWGTQIPTDPGEHTLSAEAPGRAPWSTKIVLAEASNKELEVPAARSVAGSTRAARSRSRRHAASRRFRRRRRRDRNARHGWRFWPRCDEPPFVGARPRLR
jgi:hypothetical protein